MNLASMALGKAEKDQDTLCCGPSDGKRPNYPWELKLYLTQADLEKLGITERPAIGTLFTLTCAAIVEGTSESASASADGGETSNKTVNMQITDMAAEPAGKSDKPAAEVLYS